jgi:hypothetical protein
MPDDIWIDFERRRIDRLREAWDRRRRGLPVDDQASLPRPPEPRTTVFVSKLGDRVLVQMGAESDDGMVRDRSEIVEPGGSLYGRLYAFWAALEPGEHKLDLGG